MFQRIFNVQVSQNVISTTEVLSDSESEGNMSPSFFKFLPPHKKRENAVVADVLTSTIFYEISERFAFDKATCLNIPIYFHF